MNEKAEIDELENRVEVIDGIGRERFVKTSKALVFSAF